LHWRRETAGRSRIGPARRSEPSSRLPQAHDDVSINFQLNRWLGWMTPQALPEVASIASHIYGYADFTSAFLELGDRLLTEGRRLDAAFCYRAAEFFLLPGDERKAPARQRFVELVRDVYGIGPEHMASVPIRTRQSARLPLRRPTQGNRAPLRGASIATSKSSSP